MPKGFRIRSLEIEGFKGFAEPKKLDIGERHIFLLGRNSSGKSSIVDAIRWGLFPNSFNEVVAHRKHPGDCKVVIALMRDDKEWNLQRTLVLGTNRSDYTLTDEFGEPRLISELVPAQDTLDTGEGIHIIFTSQYEPLRRQPGDLNPFQRTVLNHLGLLRPKALINEIGEFLDENEELVDRFDDRLTRSRQEIDSKVAHLQSRRSGFLNPAPWGDEPQPTLADSENKARDLIQAISGAPPDDSLANVSLPALIADADEALKQRREQSIGELERESNAIGMRRQKLENLQTRRIEVDDAENQLQSVQSQIRSELGNMTSEGISKDLSDAEDARDEAELKSQIVDATASLLELEQPEHVACPICSAEHPLIELRESVNQHQEATEVTYNQTERRLSEKRRLLQKAKQLESERDASEKSLESAKRLRSWVLSNVDEEDKNFAEGAHLEDIAKRIAQLSQRESSLNEQIADRQKSLGALEVRLQNLRQESNFHQVRQELRDAQKSQKRFERVVNAYGNLVAFGESAREIQKVVEKCFGERMKDEIPNVSDVLSKVFAGLTQHPHYDKLVFDENALDEAKLILRVASSKDDAIPMDTSVLNGQAQEALALVPHIAFSQSEDATTEMHLLMLDDPTRAFDQEHIKILVEHLSLIGQQAQLIVASHETERFRDLLPKHFAEGSYAIVEPTNWSPTEGPELIVEYK